MSCNRQCFDPADPWHDHDDCSTCSGKDDGASLEVKLWRRANWTPTSAPPVPVLQPHFDHKD